MSKHPFDDNPSFWQIVGGMIIFIIFLIALNSLLNERDHQPTYLIPREGEYSY